MPSAADPAEPAHAFDARRGEYVHEDTARGASEPPLDVGWARGGSHRVSSSRALGGDPARRSPAAIETEPYPEDEGHGAPERDAADRSPGDAELGVPAEAKAADTPLERKRAAVQATLERKLREAEARAARGPGSVGTGFGTRAGTAVDVTITPSTPGRVSSRRAGPAGPAPTRPDAEKRMTEKTTRAREVRAYRAAELRALNGRSRDAPPPGFVADPRWSPAREPPRNDGGAVAKPSPTSETLSSSEQNEKSGPGASPSAAAAAAAEAAAAAAAAARDGAETEAARAAASAVARANTARWSLWSPGDPSSAAKRRDPPADALDPGRALEDGRFREPEFRAEKKAAAAARAARDDARAAVDLGAALGDERHSRLSLVSFPAGALTQFAAGIAGVLAPPSGARAPTLGILFGSWSAAASGASGASGEPPEAGGAARAWQASIAFLQPWEGAVAELVAWLEGEDAASRAAAPGSVAAKQLRPVGWLRTTAGLGAGVTEEVRRARAAAVGAEEGAFSFSEKALLDARSRPPPASAVFVSLDEVRSAVAASHAGGGAGAAAEVYDLRAETAVDFEVDGKDAGEEE